MPEEKFRILLLKDRLRRRSYGAIMRLLITTFLEAMVYCSSEILRIETVEQQNIANEEEEEEKSKIIEEKINESA
jgi:hypothetical protein